MQKIKFLIFGPRTENSLDLKGEIEKNGHEAKIVSLCDLVCKFENQANGFFCKEENILDYDIFFFRAYNENTREAQTLAEFLLENNKTVIDETLGKKYIRGKVHQARKFFDENISHPKTYQALSYIEWEKIIDKIVFPIIVKPIQGRKGRNIQKIENKQEALTFFDSNPREYFIQEYFPLEEDYRIFVVGDVVVGGFKRIIKKGEFKSNIAGTEAEAIDISNEMGEVAIRAAKILDFEIAGIDMFEKDGKFYLIEVNNAPQWEKFKKVTGINPAVQIVKYAIEKYLEKK